MALHEPQEDHRVLRNDAANYISSHWNRFFSQANHIHRLSDAPSISPQPTANTSRSQKPPESSNTSQLFGSGAEYSSWMQTPDSVSASDLEALAIACLRERPLLIWSTASEKHGFLLTFTDQTIPTGALHLLHSGNHYDALVIDSQSTKTPRTSFSNNMASQRPLNRQHNPPLQQPERLGHTSIRSQEIRTLRTKTAQFTRPSDPQPKPRAEQLQTRPTPTTRHTSKGADQMTKHPQQSQPLTILHPTISRPCAPMVQCTASNHREAIIQQTAMLSSSMHPTPPSALPKTGDRHGKRERFTDPHLDLPNTMQHCSCAASQLPSIPTSFKTSKKTSSISHL